MQEMQKILIGLVVVAAVVYIYCKQKGEANSARGVCDKILSIFKGSNANANANNGMNANAINNINGVNANGNGVNANGNGNGVNANGNGNYSQAAIDATNGPLVDLQEVQITSNQASNLYPQVPENYVGNVLTDFRNVPVPTSNKAGPRQMIASAADDQPLYTPVDEQRELPMLEKTF